MLFLEEISMRTYLKNVIKENGTHKIVIVLVNIYKKIMNGFEFFLNIQTLFILYLDSLLQPMYYIIIETHNIFVSYKLIFCF